MPELETRPPTTLVVDTHAVESYIRDAKLTVVDALAYLVVVGAFTALRILVEVPYLRAAVGLYVAVTLVAVPVKVRVAGTSMVSLAVSAAVGLAVSLPVLLFLVGRNRGTLFAEAVAALVAFTVVHVADRLAIARA